MSDSQNNTDGAEQTFISEWMNTVTNFLGDLGRGDVFQNVFSQPESKTDKKTASQELLQTYLQSFQTIGEALSKPESAAGLLNSANVLPDLFCKIFQTSWESGFNIQTQLLEKATRIGSQTNAYQFDNLDQEMFGTWTEIYEKEFQKYLNIPALGLNRSHIERANQTQDSFNIFQAKLSEFLFVLYLPIEKSFIVIQQDLAEKVKTGELPKNPEDFYRTWIKVLEGHYMTLFQSSEYAAVLNRTIEAMSEFKSRREMLMGDVLEMFAIPTRKELDELYKDLYMTKKELRAIKKILKSYNKNPG